MGVTVPSRKEKRKELRKRRVVIKLVFFGLHHYRYRLIGLMLGLDTMKWLVNARITKLLRFSRTYHLIVHALFL